MKISAVIFDMDGTLLDTEEIHHRTWNEAIMHFGANNEIKMEEYANYAGRDSDDIVAMIMDIRPELDTDPMLIVQKKKKLYGETAINARLIEDADYVLQRCKDLKLKIALATGGEREHTDAKLLHTKIGDYFHHIVTATEVEDKKPHPQTYLDALSGLNVKAENAVAIEDTEHGVNSAVDAGIYCIAKPTEATVSQDLSRAQFRVNNLRSAMNHIEFLINQE